MQHATDISRLCSDIISANKIIEPFLR